MESKYEEMMGKILKERKSGSGNRFEPPEIDVYPVGQKTAVNAEKFAKYVNRPLNHIAKFLMHELTAPGQVDETSKIILGGHFSKKVVLEKMNYYVKEYVICKQCGSPDTQMQKVDKNFYVKCLGCGAEYPVGRLK